MYDWQKYIPTAILQHYVPLEVLARFLDADTLAMITPAKGKAESDKLLVGWQLSIPADVVKQYVPAAELEKYLPDGVVATSDGPTEKPLDPAIQHPEGKLAPTDSAPTDKPAQAPSAQPATPAASGSSSSSTADMIVPAPAKVTAAAVRKPGLAGLFDSLAGNQAEQDTGAQTPPPAAYIPVQAVQSQPADGQPMVTYIPVQQANGATAFIPVQPAAPSPTYPQAQQGSHMAVAPAPIVQQATQPQYSAGGSQAAAPQQLYIQAAPATGYVPTATGGLTVHPAPAAGSSYYVPASQSAQPAAVGNPLHDTVAAQPGNYVYTAAPPMLSQDMQGALNHHNAYR